MTGGVAGLDLQAIFARGKAARVKCFSNRKGRAARTPELCQIKPVEVSDVPGLHRDDPNVCPDRDCGFTGEKRVVYLEIDRYQFFGRKRGVGCRGDLLVPADQRHILGGKVHVGSFLRCRSRRAKSLEEYG